MAMAWAEMTGAAIAVFGSFYQQGDSIVFQAQITDVATGELLRAIGRIAASADEPIKAVETLRQRTTGALATVLDPQLKSWASAAGQPPSYEAYQLYAEGMHAFFRGSTIKVYTEWELQGREAADYFHRAAALDTTFAVPLLWALYALRLARDRVRADSLAQALDERRDRLTQWERALLDAHLAALGGDVTGEYRAYSRVVEMTPGAEWNYRLAAAAYRLHRPQEAVNLLSEVDPELGWLAHWEQYWRILTSARHVLGDHEQELRDARRGRLQLPGSNVLPVYEMQALAALGRVEEFPSFSIIRSGYGQVLGELWAHDQSSAADELLANYSARFNPEEDERLWRLATWYEWTGRLEEAEAAIERWAEEDPHNWIPRARLGRLAALQGDRERAARIMASLASVETGTTLARAEIAALLGDKELAVALLRQADAEGWLWNRITLHRNRYLRESLEDYPPFVELMRPRD